MRLKQSCKIDNVKNLIKKHEEDEEKDKERKMNTNLK